MPNTEIAILGAGPAAVATACALRRLGHEVMLIGVSRNTAVEGISARTLTLLREYGLAAETYGICGPGERVGSWAGADLVGSQECIVHRAQLDRALFADATSSGVPTRAERVIRHERRGALWRVHTERERVDCLVVVDARGRRAQRESFKGPDLVAVSQRFQTRRTGRVFSRLEAIPQGWCWLADDGQGMSWLQVTCGKERSLRWGLRQHIRRCVEEVPGVAAHLSRAVWSGAPMARAATQSLCVRPGGPGLIRAGDAAVTVDPLSGQGMYEALRSVAAVIGAARGFLSGDWSAVARFMDERAREIFERTSITAAHHYTAQAERTQSPFWVEASARYRSILPAPKAGGVHIDNRPVLNGSRIQLRRAVVTPKTPRGVWKLDAVDLPRLIEFLDATDAIDLERAALHLSCPPTAVARALNWLSVHGLLDRSGKAATKIRDSATRLPRS